jgi:hypothetical protein
MFQRETWLGTQLDCHSSVQTSRVPKLDKLEGRSEQVVSPSWGRLVGGREIDCAAFPNVWKQCRDWRCGNLFFR